MATKASSISTTSRAKIQLFDRVNNKPFWIRLLTGIKPEDNRTKRNYCL